MAEYKTATALLTKDVAATCARYGLRGQIKGTWLLMSCPWRVDKNPSFVIHLESGRWKDLGREGERGDLIDLIARVTNQTTLDVVKEVCGE